MNGLNRSKYHALFVTQDFGKYGKMLYIARYDAH